ncbi:lantibiotic dehydratase family protein [Chryseobacterium rhizoplanae]|uniref:lantibiotic dehydratase family protein n=1 Tax=Chryseobacterium rhizoplanae TaxID=1609531 RepID=UPI001CE31ABE|nr:lantibiotic dehydratase family protein [Chryseobacterium rhizoplanae]UCA60123.1 lantibiotic dehydratase family protein [Chryseobacterium rhizoplanae]
MSRFPYQFFDDYVVRTPLFSRKNFQENVNGSSISNEELKAICNNSVFQEAIYLASPYVYNELIRWLNSEKELSFKEFQKLKTTILKYFSRTSTRCTPFGLFSEVGLGTFSNELKINYNSNLNKIRDTKLDMHFLVGLAQHFVQTPEIRNHLLFFPNNSIYQVGNKIRFVEYEYTKEKREYIISSAPLSQALQQVLNFSGQGKTMQQIAKIVMNEEITEDEAIDFIDELIDNQVLISEFEPIVSGSDFLEVVISVLNRIGAKNENEILISIQKRLKELDQNIGNSNSSYAEIEKLIQSFNVEYKPNHLFQTDLYYTETVNLPTFWKKELKQAISFLNKVSLPHKKTHLNKFKKAFSERFETEEVSLSYALDTEVGIGYQQDVTTKSLHPYLEDLGFPLPRGKSNINIELDPIQQILNEKLQEALTENQYEIELSDGDFKDFEENWVDLPDTISFMAEVIFENNSEKLFLDGGGGCSAANLLGRFCSEKSEIQNLTKVIAQKEEELNPEYILAEVIHLPDARIGNVIRRPTLRQYEIPYLAQSVLPKENQIQVDDLFISLKNNRIVLRSKKLNKEIKPYLTNAHNYSANPLPVYHFLCDLYSQNIRSGLYFKWGDLKHIYNFLPRVEYKNIILSKASWKITDKEIKKFSLLLNDKDQIFSELESWRKLKQIPQWIQWVKSDNKLTVNLENYDLVKMFIDSVKSEESIIIEEFLYNENDDFKREFIFPMYKNK